jgi:hypothetical protein
MLFDETRYLESLHGFIVRRQNWHCQKKNEKNDEQNRPEDGNIIYSPTTSINPTTNIIQRRSEMGHGKLWRAAGKSKRINSRCCIAEQLPCTRAKTVKMPRRQPPAANRQRYRGT